MIQLPKNIIHNVLTIKSNIVERLCYISDSSIDVNASEILSVNPFVVLYNGEKYCFSKDLHDSVPSDCTYGLLTKKKPQRNSFMREDIVCVAWLKHPMLFSPTSNQIVESWGNRFHYKKETGEPGGEGLRTPQLGALHSFMAEAQSPKNRSIIVMPTGTGKTETMLSILVANQCKKVLVTVPSDALRGQLANKFLTLGVLKKYGIIDEQCQNPRVAVLKEGMSSVSDWRSLISESNVIVTTMSLLSNCSPDVIGLLSSMVSHVFVDEAHHSEASTWNLLIKSFDAAKVTLFTATPFRNDGKKHQGKYIYSFSLKEAQDMGYYKPIDLLPIREYNRNESDKQIAEKAVERLKEDLDRGYDHILMARCATKKRALEVFEYYKEYRDLSPTIVYTGISEKSSIVEEIKQKKHKIIICVNMLGEGFDLPEMKIAAIHDARQSLPVTLQFIGRFTRTSRDTNLGKASVVLNLADKPIEQDLRDLYAKDADWNLLLPQISDSATEEQIDLQRFIEDFKNLNDSIIPFQSIQPALSTLIYDVKVNEWNPDNWKLVFKAEEYDYRFADINTNGDTLVIVLGRIEDVEFGNFDGVQNVTWGVVLVYWHLTPDYNHLYINTSLAGVDQDKLAEALFDNQVERITGTKLFRVFHGVSRFAVQTFGGRKMGDVSFKSYYGKDVEEGVQLMERKELTKNNIFGIGYRNGNKTSIGCTIKGKVWSYMRGNIKEFCRWCDLIGGLIANEAIDDDIVLSNTLKITPIRSLPQVMPMAIDWDADVYRYPEKRYEIIKGGKSYFLSDVELVLLNSQVCPYIDFAIYNDDLRGEYRIVYEQDEDGKCHYHVCNQNGDSIGFRDAGHYYEDLTDYFNTNNNAPVIYFINGAILYANNYVIVNKAIESYPINDLVSLDWTGVDISKESQHVVPYELDSIQNHFAQHIMDAYELLYDDDGSGEISDLIGFAVEDKTINIHLFHLKFASNGLVSNQITNFYEVCGQATKCLKWRDKDRVSELFDHLFKRKTKKYQNRECSRIMKGTEELLEQMSTDAQWKKELKFSVSIVQPALSKSDPSPDILNLLGVVKTYLVDVANVKLSVYCSE
jgi:superfamily II DNA or RNA helicase